MFLTVAALRINWASVICDRVVLTKFLEAGPRVPRGIFLNNRTPMSARFGQGGCGPVGDLLNIVHSIECLHIMGMMESHVCANRIRIHMKCVHPLMKLGKCF